MHGLMKTPFHIFNLMAAIIHNTVTNLVGQWSAMIENEAVDFQPSHKLQHVLNFQSRRRRRIRPRIEFDRVFTLVDLAQVDALTAQCADTSILFFSQIPCNIPC